MSIRITAGRLQLGIATVYQDLALATTSTSSPTSTSARAHSTGPRARSTLLDEPPMEQHTRELLGTLGVGTLHDVRAQVGRLSGGQRQSVAIARSLLGAPRLVILDEPTAALGVAETAEVLALIHHLRARGLGVIVISHNLDTVFDVADRIVVLRLGRRVATFDPPRRRARRSSRPSPARCRQRWWRHDRDAPVPPRAHARARARRRRGRPRDLPRAAGPRRRSGRCHADRTVPLPRPPARGRTRPAGRPSPVCACPLHGWQERRACATTVRSRSTRMRAPCTPHAVTGCPTTRWSSRSARSRRPCRRELEALDEEHTADCRILMHQVREGRIGSLAFVEPPAPARSFDLYDLAIDTAVTLRRTGVDADLTLVTAQPGPLAILGVRTAGALRHTLDAHGLRVVDSAYVRSIGYGELELAPLSRRIAADRVIAAPRLAGPRLQNLPSDRDGFVPVDLPRPRSRLEAVFAAGDCTPFPVKHPSLAAQQADVVASTIAADAGLPVTAEPFTPVLRGVLPSRLRWYVEAPLTGGEGDATVVSPHPLWSPDLRFDARFLAPRLTQAVGCSGRRHRQHGERTDGSHDEATIEVGWQGHAIRSALCETLRGTTVAIRWTLSMAAVANGDSMAVDAA